METCEARARDDDVSIVDDARQGRDHPGRSRNTVSGVSPRRREHGVFATQTGRPRTWAGKQRLETQPMVVFTAAYDEYAVRAFEVNSVDYLLKPIEADRLAQALDKVERFRGRGWTAGVQRMIEQLARSYRGDQRMTRLPSRLGDRTQFVDLARVTHVYARDKLTYASTPAKDYPIDFTIADLERRLEADGFLRIHRSMLVNLRFVHELDAWTSGGGVLRLNDTKKTELPVARDRVRALKERLGVS